MFLRKFLVCGSLIAAIQAFTYIIQTSSTRDIDYYMNQYDAQFNAFRASKKANTFRSFNVGNITGFMGDFDDELLGLLYNDSSILEISAEKYLKLDAVQTQEFSSRHLLRLTHKNLIYDNQPELLYDASAGIGVDVAIIDSGVNGKHCEFTGRVKRIFDFVNEAGIDDPIGHGTALAGVVGSETYGVAKKCNIVDIKVASRDRVAKLSDVISALNLVVSQSKETKRPTVILLAMSISRSKLLDSIVQKIVDQGIPVITSAGNDGRLACSNSPSSASGSLSVGSIDDATNKIAGFSNWGACIDIFSSGVDVTTTGNTGNTATKASGTSVSAGIVAGLTAYYMGTGKSGFEAVQMIKQVSTDGIIEGLLLKPYTQNKIAHLDSSGSSL
ncbi:hypothetical protein DASC09_033130 [Saccharomycopsis crataegensis]|uniref:Peptidase S8/S53 domain-containing protein n=1 Tax=Saccharomycopsis crataegensis TaxID=43959 RepID=A0AAV5QM91_9ASCO|nr:hypothetical protein DASC09_033130 [Saccharomycopsis crataegensis]